MAYTAGDFKQDLIILTSGAMIGKERLLKFYKEIGTRGVNLLRPGFFPAVEETSAIAGPGIGRRIATRLAVRSPYIAGGVALAEAVRRAPETVEDLFDASESSAIGLGIPTTGIKRQRTKYNRAISAGMKALKASKFYGKPKTFNDSKKAFGEVNKIASKLTKGKSLQKTGAPAILKKAMRRFFNLSRDERRRM
jgi:hypothetical protein